MGSISVGVFFAQDNENHFAGKEERHLGFGGVAYSAPRLKPKPTSCDGQQYRLPQRFAGI
jgi:hypothetical protein